LSTAVDAVNKGQIFRFLMKPCSPDELSQSLKAGLEQYRLVTAERELLEKTLSRSVKLLTDMLSFVNPIAFGRALRLRRIVGQITASMKLLGGWQFELAAMLSQTGCVALPSDLLEKASRGEPLTKNEQSVYASHPMIGHRLLEGIPRLEPIASMVKDQNRPYASYASQPYSYKTQDIDLGAQLLKAVVDYDHLRQGGLSHAEAISAMRGDPDTYNPEIVDALAECKIDRNDWVTQVVVADAVKPGMILDEDLYAKDGKLLAPKGLEITAPVLEQIALVVKGVGIVEPFRVLASSVKSVVPAE
jgi:response regulator RpfG family c-di-GMP phosphodiesterase